MDVRVRSWSPAAGPFVGYLITHMESLSIADHLTLREGGRIVYRPTVHYAYRPARTRCCRCTSWSAGASSRNRASASWRRTSSPGRTSSACCWPAIRAAPSGSARSCRSTRRARSCRTPTPRRSRSRPGSWAGWRRPSARPAAGPGRARGARLPPRAGTARPYLGRVVGAWCDWTPLTGPRPAVPRDARPQRPLAVRQCPRGLNRPGGGGEPPAPPRHAGRLPLPLRGRRRRPGPGRVHGPAVAAGTVIVADEDGSLRRRALPLAAALAQGWDRARDLFQLDHDLFLPPRGCFDDLFNHSCEPSGGWRLTAAGRPVRGDPGPRRRRGAHLRLFLPPAGPRRADGLRLRERVLPRHDRAVRHAARALRRRYRRLGVVSSAVAPVGLTGARRCAAALGRRRAAAGRPPACGWRCSPAAISAAKVALFAVGSASFLAARRRPSWPGSISRLARRRPPAPWRWRPASSACARSRRCCGCCC